MVEVGRFVGELKAAGIGLFAGVPRYGAVPAAEELLRVCGGHVRGEPRDRRERGRRGWMVGGALTEYCGNQVGPCCSQ